MADKNAEKTTAIDNDAKKNVPAVKTEQKPVREKVSFRSRVKKFFKDYRSELKKIVWPTREQVLKNTGIVIGVIVIVSIFVGAFDTLFGFGVNALGKLGSILQGS